MGEIATQPTSTSACSTSHGTIKATGNMLCRRPTPLIPEHCGGREKAGGEWRHPNVQASKLRSDRSRFTPANGAFLFDSALVLYPTRQHSAYVVPQHLTRECTGMGCGAEACTCARQRGSTALSHVQLHASTPNYKSHNSSHCQAAGVVGPLKEQNKA